jgi:hypothetical protein
MASKKVWIVGGCLVVVAGAVAYLSSNSSTPGKDAAGTIVEVSRTHTDSTAPATADQAATPAPAAGTADAAAAADAAKGETAGNASAAADAADAAGGNGATQHGKSMHGSDHGGYHGGYHGSDHGTADRGSSH